MINTKMPPSVPDIQKCTTDCPSPPNVLDIQPTNSMVRELAQYLPFMPSGLYKNKQKIMNYKNEDKLHVIGTWFTCTLQHRCMY